MSMRDPYLCALALASNEHEHNFSSRRSIGPWQRSGKLRGFYVNDNNPVGNNDTFRDRLYGVFAIKMMREQCYPVAFASYPLKGEQPHYTFAIIFESLDPTKAEEHMHLAHAHLQAEIHVAHAALEKGARVLAPLLRLVPYAHDPTP